MRIFYGWWVLGGLFAMYATTNGITNFTLPLLYPSLMEEFGWNHAEVTRPAAIKFLFASLYNLAVGFLMDRYAPRPIMAAGGLIMLSGLLAMIFMSEIWHFTAAYLLLAFGMAMCGLVPCMVTTSRWFVKYRGRATGVLLMASSFGGAVLPLAIRGELMDSAWRNAVLILAAIGIVGILLPLIWPVRARPEDRNELPDGISADDDDSVASTEPLGIVGGITLAEGARMPAFYLLLIATGILWFCITGVIQHQAIYLGRDNGMDGGALAVLFSVFFWCSIFGKFIFGYLSDYFAKLHIMLLAIVNLGVGLVILRFVRGTDLTVIYLYAVVYGIGFSGAFTMIQLMIAELFAGPTYGRFLGLYVGVDTISAAAGIAALGEIRVLAGSYIPAIDMMLGMVLVALGCVFALKWLAGRRPVATAQAQE